MNKRLELTLTLLALWLTMVPVVGAQAGAEVTVGMSQETAVLMAGDWVEFTTTLRNDGAATTPPLVVQLSIAPIDTRRHVDPEDWLPQMTQYLPALLPGASASLPWRIHTLFEGRFVAFVSVLAQDGALAPSTGAPLQIQVSPDDILPLKAVIPVAAIVPMFPLTYLLWLTAGRLRDARGRRQDQVVGLPGSEPRGS